MWILVIIGIIIILIFLKYNTETEIEIFTLTKDGKNLVFGNKLGFGGRVNYRCDPKRSNFINAEIAVEETFLIIHSYQMILGELVKKYNIEI